MTKHIMITGGTVIAILLLSCGYLSVRLDAVKLEAKQNKLAYEQCVASSKIAEEVSNEYQSEISNLNRRLRDVRRMLADTCIPVGDAASGRDGAASDGEFRGSNGVPATRILDLAEDAERVRLRLIGCQNYITRLK